MSLSGFGRAAVKRGGFTVSCEIKATNHRNLDIAVSLGEGLESSEQDVRGMLADSMSRGRVELRASLENAGGEKGAPARLNEAAARWYGRKLAALARSMKLAPPRVEALARLPGVLEEGQSAPDTARAVAVLRSAVTEAMGKVRGMRLKEGAALAADLGRRIGVLEKGVGAIRAGWPAAMARGRAQMEERLKAALEKFQDGKAGASAKEIAGLVDRGDATEELTRLDSHLVQMRETLRTGGMVGRRLDFLVQEVNRELHTTGAKSASAELAHMVVALKEESERIREQVQNLL
jgi:uncharacterized protein (TIGR00255 family)